MLSKVVPPTAKDANIAPSAALSEIITRITSPGTNRTSGTVGSATDTSGSTSGGRIYGAIVWALRSISI
ncbi:hypothetical protein G6F53_014255 [Rhizopus delemar]|nr:hypothetical protein G6F53_014255 [Rhizopus delemar]